MDSEHKKFLESIRKEIANQGKSIASTIDKLDLSVNVIQEQEKKGMLGNLADTLGSLSGGNNKTNENLENANQQQQEQFGIMEAVASQQTLTKQILENIHQQQQQQFGFVQKSASEQ